MAVILDLLDSGQLREDASGYADTIEAIVDGVSTDPWRGRWEALTADGVPRRGEPHPVIPGLVCKSRSVSSVAGSTTRRRVRIEYGPPDAADVDRTERYGPTEWSGSVRTFTETTLRDWRGDLMTVFYTGVPQFESVSTQSGAVFTTSSFQYTQASRTSKAEVDRTLFAMSARRWERDDPEQRLRGIGSKTNADYYRRAEPQTLLLEGAFFDSDPAGGYRVEYLMTYNPRTWRAEHRITVNGLTPIDLTEGNGIEYHEIYEPIQFSALQL